MSDAAEKEDRECNCGDCNCGFWIFLAVMFLWWNGVFEKPKDAAPAKADAAMVKP